MRKQIKFPPSDLGWRIHTAEMEGIEQWAAGNASGILRSTHDTWHVAGQQDLRAEPKNIQLPKQTTLPLAQSISRYFCTRWVPQSNSQLERSFGYLQIFQLWPCACLLTWPVAMRGIYLRSRYSFLTARSTWVPAFCRSGPHCPMEVYIYDTSRTCMSCCGQGIEGPPSLRVALSFVYSKVFSSDFYGFYF